MMKNILMAAVILLLATQVKGQILQPVHWSYAAKKISKTAAIVFIKATIDDGWHVYSQFVKDGGPVKTTITFNPSNEYTLDGKTIEPSPVIRLEKAFNMEVGFFERSVIFRQMIKLKASQTIVDGKLEYMTCNDQKCLPPGEINFTIIVK
jgi:hypothetical protein